MYFSLSISQRNLSVKKMNYLLWMVLSVCHCDFFCICNTLRFDRGKVTPLLYLKLPLISHMAFYLLHKLHGLAITCGIGVNLR